MNILYLTNHLNIGGITSYVDSLSSGLKERGHNIYIASSGGDKLHDFLDKGINFIQVPLKTKAEFSPKIIISFFKLLPYIKENKIDIIHANTRVTQVLACFLSFFSGKPFISTCHGFFKTRFVRLLFPCWGKKVIAISQQVEQHLRHDFKVNPAAISLINNGIDVGRFANNQGFDRQLIRKELGIGEGLVVGIVGRLSDVKGHIYLIKAISIVAKDVPQVKLLIIGEGKMFSQLIDLTKQLGIEDKVFFINSVMDTRRVLAIMDLFVMPSLKEGLGLALMEAMASGLPVIGSNVGGIKTLIADGYNGLLVEPADVPGLAQAITVLINDPEKRKAFGANASIFIQKNFSLKKMLDQTEEVYENV